jgi:Hydrazine synthase alpha subunit middle domain
VRHLLLLACILLLFTAKNALTSATSDDLPSFIYVAAEKYEPLAWMHSKDRFPHGAKLFIQDASGHRPLIPDFAVSADPAVSFDGKHLLFAGRKTSSDHWQIWEMNLPGGAPRRLTSCADSCIRPFYLPEERFVFAEKVRSQTVIKAASLQGGESLALTYGVGNSLPSDVLRDGRILFDTVVPSNDGSPEIFTVYSDGSGVESYRCDHGSARHSGRQLASGDIVFARQHGLARFTSALAHEVEVPVSSQDFAGELAELANGNWLLASRSRPNGRFQVSRWTPGMETIQIVLSDDYADLIQPTLIYVRPVPHRHPSGLHDWNYANLLCLNAYTSKLHIPGGTISAVRLYTRDESGQVNSLGTAVVEKDGSFYLRVPGDRPLKIALLDAAGRSVQKEAGWFWLRRGEQRICVGCHAGPETAPENLVPAVLLRSTVAADITAPAVHTASGGH